MSNTNNHRSAQQLREALDAILTELAALDATMIADGDLVPFAKTVQSVGAFATVIDNRIKWRAITDKVAVPGVAVKPGITHRKWNDAEAVAALAFEAFGLKAFKLESPAAIEKLGDDGKALVAIASTKPAADDRVVY